MKIICITWLCLGNETESSFFEEEIFRGTKLIFLFECRKSKKTLVFLCLHSGTNTRQPQQIEYISFHIQEIHSAINILRNRKVSNYESEPLFLRFFRVWLLIGQADITCSCWRFFFMTAIHVSNMYPCGINLFFVTVNPDPGKYF